MALWLPDTFVTLVVGFSSTMGAGAEPMCAESELRSRSKACPYIHRIHVCHIYGNIYHQYTPVVLPSIYHTYGSVMGIRQKKHAINHSKADIFWVIQHWTVEPLKVCHFKHEGMGGIPKSKTDKNQESPVQGCLSHQQCLGFMDHQQPSMGWFKEQFTGKYHI